MHFVLLHFGLHVWHPALGGMSERSWNRSEVPLGELPAVVQEHYALPRWLMQRVAKYPRDLKFTLGDRTVNPGLEVLERLPCRRPAHFGPTIFTARTCGQPSSSWM